MAFPDSYGPILRSSWVVQHLLCRHKSAIKHVYSNSGVRNAGTESSLMASGAGKYTTEQCRGRGKQMGGGVFQAAGGREVGGSGPGGVGLGHIPFLAWKPYTRLLVPVTLLAKIQVNPLSRLGLETQ